MENFQDLRNEELLIAILDLFLVETENLIFSALLG